MPVDWFLCLRWLFRRCFRCWCLIWWQANSVLVLPLAVEVIVDGPFNVGKFASHITWLFIWSRLLILVFFRFFMVLALRSRNILRLWILSMIRVIWTEPRHIWWLVLTFVSKIFLKQILCFLLVYLLLGELNWPCFWFMRFFVYDQISF